MTIQLGTVAPIGFSDFSPAEWLDCLRQLGCQVVQAYRKQDAGITVQQMKDAIAAGGLPCDSLHGVYGEEYDPSSVEEPARRSAVAAFRAEGDLVRQLGGSLVVVHGASIRKEGISGEEKKTRIKQLSQSIRELGEYGQSIGVRYAFENLPPYHAIGFDVEELDRLLAGLNVPYTGMCFDTGHANMVENPADAVRKTSGQIIYVHLSDNSGQADEHLMPSDGCIDLDDLADALRQINFSGTVMLEVFHKIDRLQKMIDEGYGQRIRHFIDRANGLTH